MALCEMNLRVLICIRAQRHAADEMTNAYLTWHFYMLFASRHFIDAEAEKGHH